MYALLIGLFATFFLHIIKLYLAKPQVVYLEDFTCLKQPTFCRLPLSTYLEHIRLFDFLDKESADYMSKLLTSLGHGDQTYVPPCFFSIPPNPTYIESMQEARMVLFPVFEDLLSKTNLKADNIDILIVNCSGFCPAPSLSSIIINKYPMKEDIKSYTLTGMGCGANAIAIDMAKNLLKIYKNSNALILSTEILSTGWYGGNEQAKMMLNCTFRMGSAAILLTNKSQAKYNAKYKLLRTLRTQRAFDNKAYTCTFREEDSNGFLGVTSTKDLLQAVQEIVHSHVTILGSLILPFFEKFLYILSLLRKASMDKSTEIYVPNFGKVIQHFCLPTPGKVFVRRIGKELQLGEKEMEASLMTCHRFGNQSSSSLWYVLAYMEAKKKVKKGDKVWQLGFGSGLKCTSSVWECVEPKMGESNSGPWADCISSYPISSL